MSHSLRFMTAAVLLALTAVAIPAADPPLSPDLALVPADAAGFVHVRVADLYRSEHFREFRQLLSKAGDDTLKAFNNRFCPAPNTVDRVTLFFFAPAGGGRGEPEVVALIATSEPFERDRLVKSEIEGKAKQDGSVYADERGTVAVYIPGDHLFALGSPNTVRKLATRGRAANAGPLTPALALAAGGKPFVAAINAAVLPAEALQHAPPQMQPFVPLLRAKLVTLVADFDKGTHLDLRLRYADAKAANEAEEAAKAGLFLVLQFLTDGRKEVQKKLTDPNLPNPGTIEQLPEAAGALLALAAINQADDILKTLPLRKDGTDLRLDVTLPPGPMTMVAATSAIGAGLLLPAVQKVREAANRTKDQNNLKQIGLAMFNYESANRGFPAHAIYSKDGKTPLLSWRVAILPYIEENNLYQQFKLDEPWDSPNNKPLIARMPEVYVVPNAAPTKEPGMTYYQVFVGKGAGWERQPRGPKLIDITDGTSNTLMVVEAANAVTWTKPDDLVFDPDKPLPKLGGHFPGGFNALFMDGSVRFLHSTIDPKVLQALITRAGGEPIDFRDFDK